MLKYFGSKPFNLFRRSISHFEKVKYTAPDAKKYGAKRRIKRHILRQLQSHNDALKRKEGNRLAYIRKLEKKKFHKNECEKILLQAESLGIRNHIFSKWQEKSSNQTKIN